MLHCPVFILCSTMPWCLEDFPVVFNKHDKYTLIMGAVLAFGISGWISWYTSTRIHWHIYVHIHQHRYPIYQHISTYVGMNIGSMSNKTVDLCTLPTRPVLLFHVLSSEQLALDRERKLEGNIPLLVQRLKEPN